MKNYHFNSMSKGWFIGDFSPCALNWKGGEISVKHFPKGYVMGSYYHEKAAKYYVVMKGKLSVGGQIAEEGKIVYVEPAEDLPLVALNNTVVLLCVVGDCKFTRFYVDSLAKELEIYDSLYTHVEYGGPIQYEDISVVVQGAVERKITPICMESIRRFLPGSKIVLSTWEGTDIEGIDCDELVLNKDPGGYICTMKSENMGLPNNINRQLVSVQNGLRRVKSKYTLKLRTDMILTTNEFLRYFELFPYRMEEYRIFQKRVIVADLYTRHSFQGEKGFIPMPFHVSDWFFFGLSEDIRKYFIGTKLMAKEEQVEFLDIKKPERREEYGYSWYWRFPPEQYYCIQAAERNFPDIRMQDWSDWDEGLLRKSEKFIMNNFIVLDFRRHGINLPKYEMSISLYCGGTNHCPKGLYTYDIFKHIYESVSMGQGIPAIWDEEVDYNQNYWMFREEAD